MGLIPLALQFLGLLPSAASLVTAIAGPKAGQVAQDVVNIAQQITGTSEPNAALEAMKAKPELLTQFASSMAQYQVEAITVEINAQRDVIVAEAKSESWITRNWRPLSMLVFTALIVLHWFGLTAVIPENQVAAILEIIKYGLSGYVVGRSAEKVFPSIMAALKGK
jgi:hypothetical protein